MIIEITPEGECYYPNTIRDYNKDSLKIFLAGTIDNGESYDWQQALIWKLALYTCTPDNEEDLGSGYDFSLGAEDDNDIIVFNPRRANWSPNATDEDVVKQIEWEQEHLDQADLIVMYLADNSESPISLLELGLYGPQGKMIVCCTDKFYRYNNVKCTCDKYMIDLYESNDISDIVDKIAVIYLEMTSK